MLFFFATTQGLKLWHQIFVVVPVYFLQEVVAESLLHQSDLVTNREFSFNLTGYVREALFTTMILVAINGQQMRTFYSANRSNS